MPKIKHRKDEDYPNYKQKVSRLYEDDFDEYEDEDEEDKPEIKLNKYEDKDFIKFMYEQFEKSKEKPKQPTIEQLKEEIRIKPVCPPPYEGREDSIGPLGFGIALWFIIAIGLAL